MQCSAYVNFDSNCTEAFEFYQSLGIGKIEMIMTNDQGPADMPFLPGREKNVLHASMKIGDTLLMASDMQPGAYVKPQGVSLHIGAASIEEAERLFAALSEKGEVHMPLTETFWALRFGACTDRFGIPWLVDVGKPM